MAAAGDYFSWRRHDLADNINWEEWQRATPMWDSHSAQASPSSHEAMAMYSQASAPPYWLPHGTPLHPTFSPLTYPNSAGPIPHIEPFSGPSVISPTFFNAVQMSPAISNPDTSRRHTFEGRPTHYSIDGQRVLGLSRSPDLEDEAFDAESPKTWQPTPIETTAADALKLWDGGQPQTTSPPGRSRQLKAQQKPKYRRSHTDGDSGLKEMKDKHNAVERNYRDRLNDQIAELSNYLFESNTDSKGSRPPKSLVISRANDRLKELTSQNEDLINQVEKLKQHIAVLDHIIADGSDRSTTTSTDI